jgi:hypothetical protein
MRTGLRPCSRAHRADTEYRFLVQEARGDQGGRPEHARADRVAAVLGRWLVVGIRQDQAQVHAARPARARRPGATELHRDRTQPPVVDRHHRAPHRRRQALPLRDQGCLVQAHRRVHDRLPDEVPPGPSAPGTVTTYSDPWAGSAHAQTTPPWSRSSHSCRRTSWTAGPGPPASTCAWPSSPGSNAPITAGAGRPGDKPSRSPRATLQRAPACARATRVGLTNSSLTSTLFGDWMTTSSELVRGTRRNDDLAAADREGLNHHRSAGASMRTAFPLSRRRSDRPLRA